MFRRSFSLLALQSRNLHMNPTTDTPIPHGPAQKALDELMIKKKYTDRVWVTPIQGIRTFNTLPKPDEKPAVIHFEIEEVLAFENLTAKSQQKFIDQHTPFFTGGVAIFGGVKMNWLPINAARFKKILNPGNRERALWIDKNVIEDLGLVIKPGREQYENIGEVSTFEVMNSSQFEFPHKIAPVMGLALSSHTGKRFAQPAHDLLLSIQILRGYNSPFWFSVARGEKACEQFGTKALPGWEEHVVEVGTGEGLAYPFEFLSDTVRQKITKRFGDAPKSPWHQMLSVGGWELQRRATIVTQFHSRVDGHDEKLRTPTKWVLLDHLVSLIGKDSYANMMSGLSKKRFPKFAPVDLAEASKVTLLNASQVVRPEFVVPKARIIQVKRGRLFGIKNEVQLRERQIAKKYPAPLWVTRSDCRHLGVGIKEGEKGLQLGHEMKEIGDLFNLDDLESPLKNLLKAYPLPPGSDEASKPYIFEALRWRVENTRSVRDVLDKGIKGTNKRNIWVAATEVYGNQFPTKHGAQPLKLGKIRRHGKDEKGEDHNNSATELFNVAQTTDPVRVIGTMTFFVRPQGGFMM